MVHWLGELGFLYTWLGVELFQIVRIIGLNQELFAHTGEHRLTYVYRLMALCGAGLLISGVILSRTYQGLYRWQFVAGFGVSAVLAVAAFFLFDMRAVVQKLYARIGHRLGGAV
jgi:hypothetical protein